jgi:hypothetical protein
LTSIPTTIARAISAANGVTVSGGAVSASGPHGRAVESVSGPIVISGAASVTAESGTDALVYVEAGDVYLLGGTLNGSAGSVTAPMGMGSRAYYFSDKAVAVRRRAALLLIYASSSSGSASSFLRTVNRLPLAVAPIKAAAAASLDENGRPVLGFGTDAVSSTSAGPDETLPPFTTIKNL